MIVYTTIEGQSENGRNHFPQYSGMIIYPCYIMLLLIGITKTSFYHFPGAHQEDQALRAGRREEAQGTDDSVLILFILTLMDSHWL